MHEIGFKNQRKQRLNVVGLFSGIGGFELGMHAARNRTSLLCELDPAARAVLNIRFPRSEIIDDVRSIDSLPKGTDIVCAGFPCQDLSSVGQKEGINGARSSVVSEVFRILRKSPVEWVLIENVAFMLHLNSGLAMNFITENLERLGYSWAYRVLDSHAFGVPQRRKRVYLIASLHYDPRDVLLSQDTCSPLCTKRSVDVPLGFYWTEGTYAVGFAVNAIPPIKGGSTIGIPSPPAVLFPDGRVVTPDIRDSERLQGFEANWTTPAESIVRRSVRWRLIGNAVTVKVIEWIAEKMKSPVDYDSSNDAPLTQGYPWPKAAWSVGGARFASLASDTPIWRAGHGIDRFLEFEPKPLSSKATNGFIKRARAGNLRFPKGFLKALDKHARLS
jgi:DNA (cytosine-5)-methyltransferase 1